ncbi:MAG: OstA-like protein, partial [Sediminibacterium sp.]
MLRPFRLSLPLVLLFSSIIAFAQKGAVTQQPKDDEIKILHSNFTYLEVNSANELKVLTGDVQLFHDSSFLYCDSARIEGLLVKAYGKVVIRRSDTVQIFADSLRYDGKAKATDLFGEVILINGGKSLYTRRLHYDLDSSIASYNTPATLRTKQTVLKSKRGYYHVHKDMAYFYGNVQLSDPEIQLRSDSLEFNTSTQTAIFVAPTLMEKNDRKIYCESGYYDVDDKVAEFRGNPQYSELDKKATSDIMLYDGKANEINLIKHVKFVSSDTQLEGDSVLYNEKDKVMTLLGKGNIITKDGIIGSTKKLVYNEKTGQFTTSGRAALQDSTNQLDADEIIRDSKSGNLTARGNVYWMDTAQHSGILCDSMFLDKASNKVIAIGFNHQPVFKSFSNPADTLYLAADTLIAFQTDSIHKDKNIRAYHKVKVYRSDLQAICDSLTYSEKDSIFTLFNHPIIWSDTSQFFGDTIKILQSGNKLQRMYLLQNAMIINSGDLIYFNQIKGRKITADFDSSELSNVDVLGNAEAVYYAIDDDRAYIGVNKIICSHILAKFGSNRVDRIYFFNKPNGTLHPMRSVDHNALKLKGFQ